MGDRCAIRRRLGPESGLRSPVAKNGGRLQELCRRTDVTGRGQWPSRRWPRPGPNRPNLQEGWRRSTGEPNMDTWRMEVCRSQVLPRGRMQRRNRPKVRDCRFASSGSRLAGSGVIFVSRRERNLVTDAAISNGLGLTDLPFVPGPVHAAGGGAILHPSEGRARQAGARIRREVHTLRRHRMTRVHRCRRSTADSARNQATCRWPGIPGRAEETDRGTGCEIAAPTGIDLAAGNVSTVSEAIRCILRVVRVRRRR